MGRINWVNCAKREQGFWRNLGCWTEPTELEGRGEGRGGGGAELADCSTPLSNYFNFNNTTL